MKTSISDTLSYLDVCNKCLIDKNVFNNFKSNPNYTRILEHVYYNEGLEYLNVIKRDNVELLKYIIKFKTNDDIGNPNKFFYNELNEYLSPTTLRYIKVLSDLINIYGDLENLDIVEIGVGYGGQCKIISDIFTFKSYTLIDLDTVLGLSKLYLSNFEIKNLIFKTLDEINDVKFDLVISNYAFTEIRRDLQDQYKNKIIDNSKNGYLTCNFFDFEGNSTVNIDNILSYSVNDILKMNDNGIKIPEEPITASTNFIYTWRNRNNLIDELIVI